MTIIKRVFRGVQLKKQPVKRKPVYVSFSSDSGDVCRRSLSSLIKLCRCSSAKHYLTW